jgi:septal ring factor EnvC (AmiA/AmiB activator)
MILNNLTSKIAAFFLIGGFLLGCIFVVINASNKLTQLRAEIKQLQAQLQNCKDTNQQLINQIQVQQENYIKAQKEIEEASKKPIKKVYIKQTIKEPVYITNEKCQQIVDLIKQAEVQLK